MKKSELKQIIREEIENIDLLTPSEQAYSSSLIKQLRLSLSKILKQYKGKLSRNTLRDEFRNQMDKI